MATVVRGDAYAYLQTLPDNSVNLVLTDPPYTISRDSGMQKHFEAVQDGLVSKTDTEWAAYHLAHPDVEGTPTQKANYLQYGTIYGKKYAVQTNYGAWDDSSAFTPERMQAFVKLFYQKLRKGGTVIIFYDVWKISYLKEMLEQAKFKQVRFIEWIKTNPQPLNSKRNYLTNCREVALTAVKHGSGTFHSSYDTGIYRYPLQGGKCRIHPTQKSLKLFTELVTKHSNEGDVIVDPFLGSGTTLMACLATKRRCIGCELDSQYYTQMKAQVQAQTPEGTVEFVD
jgi:site-specific DNA-methyltransferase (adenine-specific)